MECVADARMGDEDAAEALSGAGCVEGGAVPALRGEPPNDPRLGRVGRAGPGSGGRRHAVLVAAAARAQAGRVHKGIIEARLAEFSRLSAPRWFDEVRAAGYARGYGRVRDYVRVMRPRELA